MTIKEIFQGQGTSKQEAQVAAAAEGLRNKSW